MISLFPLRPIQIVDVSFQLLRKRFIKSFIIALCISLPLQTLLWILESSQPSDTNIQGRIVLIIAIVQFFAVGFSLTLSSYVLGKTSGRVYCETIFNNLYQVQKSSARAILAAYHVGLHLIFAFGLIGLRYLLGKIVIDTSADVITALTFVTVGLPWIFGTLYLGFAAPISTHEGGTFTSIRKRARQINKVHYYKLVGVYCICLFMILVLVIPSLTAVQLILAKNFVTSDVGTIALINLIIAVVIASISAVYSFILTVTYFNARIEYEGFDIAVSIDQTEMEGGMRGKLFDSVA